ncbi:MAG TPA: hypothetical protein VGL93_28590 [Streptosporangiaceae bacterium]
MPSVVRHITPVAPDRARDLVAEVYAQVNAEFSSIGPAILMTSPSPEILAAGWSLLRESQLTGTAPVPEKTLAALGVSQANGCGYDTLSYLAALRLMGAGAVADAVAGGGAVAEPRPARVFGWARASASGAVAEMPPVGGAAAEFLGTVLFTHFVNRMVLAMLPPDLEPGDLTADAPAPFEGAPVLRVPAPDLGPGGGASVPVAGEPGRGPGASLGLLSGHPHGTRPDWSDGPVGTAYGVLAATAAQGAGLLSPTASATVAEVVAANRGRIAQGRPHGVERLDGLGADDRAGARVAILTALAPARLTDADVAAWRATDPRFTDHRTVHLLAYGAMTAVTHIEADLTRTVAP